jgi:hypothetical protein
LEKICVLEKITGSVVVSLIVGVGFDLCEMGLEPV